MSLGVCPFLTVWDMILGHPTDISAQVADAVFRLSLNRLLDGTVRRPRNQSPHCQGSSVGEGGEVVGDGHGCHEARCGAAGVADGIAAGQ